MSANIASLSTGTITSLVIPSALIRLSSGTSGSSGSSGTSGSSGSSGNDAGITSYTNATDNYVLTAVSSSTINGEVNLQFDGTDLKNNGDYILASSMTSKWGIEYDSTSDDLVFNFVG